MSILIVGASVAGIRTAQALRMQGYSGDITLIGEELHHPYDKPPLSKEMLARGEPGPVALLTVEELDALNVTLRLGACATRLDPIARTVETDDGSRLDYAELVIATGVNPRTLPGPTPAGVYTIRTADDTMALRSQLLNSPAVVVIGAGFIGAEFASAAREYGCQVCVVEIQETPMAHILGPEVGGLLAQLHQAHGVELLTGVGFDHYKGTDRVSGVVLTDGRVLPADLVVVGIGTVPATGWLESSGLLISDGVECDENLRVVGFPHIHAAGDVARWPHPLYGFPLRIEHWTNANEHGAFVAADILGKPHPAAQVPYVWSDQYGHRIQLSGRPGLGRLNRVQGTADDHLVALYADDDHIAVGAVVVDNPRAFLKVRKAIARRVTVDEIELPSVALPAAP